ncbi:LysR family transcriptional regulator [Cupriavidus numazuensis]|uniref:HTH-type transcriptional regulator GltC n=1 Tax=Cupriavidus numazuensis TaxID=221992 RepID=A0ABM8TI90_9BURK|nr:LysR family transcriptional regulator [Cupriavidus numazuensis]CAG2147252.1 HTH-type transcriptional regulator GltC [Cupriavidus numazuensis]
MGTLSVHALTRRVDLFTLRLFLTVVDERQIRRAAIRENIAASAATKRIQDLEEIAGVQLLDRQPGGVVPSAAGEVLARHVRLLFENLEDMRREIGEFSDGVRGHITVATTGSIIIQYLAREIGEFSRNFPLVDVELKQDANANVVRAVVSGEADVAIYVASKQPDEDALDTVAYRTERLVALVPLGHALADQPDVAFADLLREPFIGIPPYTTLMTDAHHAARALGQALEPRFSVGSVEAARSLVEAGLGVTIQPECMVSLEASARVAMLQLKEPWALRGVHIGTRRGRTLTAATRALIRQLTEQPAPAGSPSDHGK